MSDKDKIEKVDFDKESLLDFSKGPTELSSAKSPSRLGPQQDDDSSIDESPLTTQSIEDRVRELDKIIEEAKLKKVVETQKIKPPEKKEEKVETDLLDQY